MTDEGTEWHGVEGVDGSDLALLGAPVVSGRGLDRVLWRGFSGALGLAGSVWVLLKSAALGCNVPLSRGPRLGDGVGIKKRRMG